MVGSSPRTGILRYILPNGLASLEFYPLPFVSEVRIGRDPSCHIALDSSLHTGVSRNHARITRIEELSFCWQIEDLGSSNGTYVNGERIHGAHMLQEGDRISLGKQGPRFVFECIFAEQSQGRLTDSTTLHADTPVHYSGSVHGRSPDPLNGITPDGWCRAVPNALPSSNSVTFSQLFPIVSTGKDLTRKAYLLPGITTVTFVVLMFIFVGRPVWFNFSLSAYLSAAAYFVVYQLCGKHKPWWILVSSGLITALLMYSPLLQVFIFIFREVLPGAIPQEATSMNLGVLLLQMFFGAGLMEELLKAVPMMLIAWISVVWRSPKRLPFGLYEPLDGILLGTASAVGFTLMETLGQYVPAIVNDVTFQAAAGVNEDLLGLQLLIPRILGSVSGHMAYSGYLGYFVGLSILKPKHRWRILLVGYLTASMLHALWNTTGFIHPVVLALVGMLSYAFLAAAVLKARTLSPTRSQNFATRFNHFL